PPRGAHDRTQPLRARRRPLVLRRRRRLLSGVLLFGELAPRPGLRSPDKAEGRIRGQARRTPAVISPARGDAARRAPPGRSAVSTRCPLPVRPWHGYQLP